MDFIAHSLDMRKVHISDLLLCRLWYLIWAQFETLLKSLLKPLRRHMWYFQGLFLWRIQRQISHLFPYFLLTLSVSFLRHHPAIYQSCHFSLTLPSFSITFLVFCLTILGSPQLGQGWKMRVRGWSGLCVGILGLETLIFQTSNTLPSKTLLIFWI